MKFERPVLIFVPCYNCAEYVLDTLRGIPGEFAGRAECLVVDNRSDDETVSRVLQAVREKSLPLPTRVIRNRENIGYAGSQKTAYTLAAEDPAVRKVIMLHGDGQYDPDMTRQFLPYLESDHALVNGYRDKTAFPRREETPLTSYYIIKLLNVTENVLTGCFQMEWHSGFVMYDTDFLRRVPLAELSATMHIDGEFLYCAEILGAKTTAVPIYKKYDEHEALGGWTRIRYVGNVFQAIGRYRRGHYREIFKRPRRRPPEISFETLGA